MKYILIITLLFSTAYAQDTLTERRMKAIAEIGLDTTLPIWINHESNIRFVADYSLQYLKENKYTLGLFFVGGMADWFVEALRFRQDDIMRMFPTSYDKILPGYTWQRKWKNGDPAQGERFFGSSTFLAWTQDPYHAVRTFETVCYTVSICIKIGEKKRWYLYVFDAFAHQAAKAVGGKVCMWIIEDSGLKFK